MQTGTVALPLLALWPLLSRQAERVMTCSWDMVMLQGVPVFCEQACMGQSVLPSEISASGIEACYQCIPMLSILLQLFLLRTLEVCSRDFSASDMELCWVGLWYGKACCALWGSDFSPLSYLDGNLVNLLWHSLDYQLTVVTVGRPALLTLPGDFGMGTLLVRPLSPLALCLLSLVEQPAPAAPWH